MEISEVERRLLALHYVFPVPLNRLEKLFEIDPNLERFPTYSEVQLTKVLNITPKKAHHLKLNLQQKSTTSLDKLYERYNITPIPFTHPYYPKQLLSLFDPPAVLYTKGDISLFIDKLHIAIIGSRKATAYSSQVMSFIVPPLVENNTVIVSGLAAGADTMAHKAAIEFGGKTIAVLGHGFFHQYPKENESLANEIANNHLLITEYPPYVKPEKWTFPARNRIISGLSDAIVVTEAANKSGTMITVEHALDYGKDVYAVPGPVTSLLSEGPNRLIDEGAKPLWNGFQIVGSFISNR